MPFSRFDADADFLSKSKQQKMTLFSLDAKSFYKR
jgi:hypothetical protein